MGHKLKKVTEDVNPPPSAYSPSHELTKPQSQRPINFESDRTDFSKSVTGKHVGPGIYEVQREEHLEMGKIGKSLKFEPNRNKNVIFMVFSLDQDLIRFRQASENFLSTVQGLKN
jgi:hypothetical protein